MEMLLVPGIPLMVGLAPAIIPGAHRFWLRWAGVLVPLLLSIWAAVALDDGRHGFHMIPIVFLWIGLASAAVRIVARHRARRPGR